MLRTSGLIAGIALLLALFLAVGFGLGAIFVRFQQGPIGSDEYYVSLFKENREEFAAHAEQILSGGGRIRSDGHGYYGSARLASLGVRSIVKENDCVYFQFGGGAVQAVYELIYSPKDFQSVAPLAGRDSNRKVLSLRRIETNWFYRCWDM